LTISDQGLAPTDQYEKMMAPKIHRSRRELASAGQVAAGDTAGSLASIRALNRTIGTILYEECLKENKRWKEFPRKFRKDPIMAAKILFNRTVNARWVGEGLIEIWECVAIC
jgi:hypothetical protein